MTLVVSTASAIRAALSAPSADASAQLDAQPSHRRDPNDG